MTQANEAIFFTGKRQAEVRPTPIPQLSEGEVLIRSRLSLMSTGTETICFARRFDPGTHWDKWVQYPFRPGYSTVGEVEKVGSGVTEFAVGDRVVARLPHGQRHVLKVNEAAKIPDELADEDAAWFALAKIAFVGALAAQLELGMRVVVIGAGPIGQMATRWCAAAGASEIVTVDFVESRLELAQAGGATATVKGAVGERQGDIISALGNKRPDVVIDSTGNSKAFADALRMCADFGRVVILGDTGSPATQTLTPDVITRGLTIVGAHDLHTRRDAERWDDDRKIFRLFFRLASTGRFSLKGMVTQRYKPEQAQEAYDFAEDSREQSMGIAFDWKE